MNDAEIKDAIKSIEIHHEHGWWVADMPDIGVATQAKTLPALGVEIERIAVAHFETAREVGADPFRCRRPSTTAQFRALVDKALDGWYRAARTLTDDLLVGLMLRTIAALREEANDVR